MLTLLLLACTAGKPVDTGAPADTDTAGTDTAVDTGGDTAVDTGDTGDTGVAGPDAFVDRVVDYVPGEAAGFGQERFPDIVYGAPDAPGDGGASTDVLTLGREGSIVIAFDDIGLVDGDGPDLLVFENPFTGWYETGHVAVSEDGETWHEWPCDPTDEANLFPGCAGVGVVYANAENGLATDPAAAGGDAYDLADLGLARARYVRVRDSGANEYAGNSGGFDLDAMAVVNGEPVE